MLKVTQTEKSGDTVEVTLEGKLDENADFTSILSRKPKNLHVICKDMGRVNSIGIGLWRRFFQSMRDGGTKLLFSEVAPALVDQMNFIKGFIYIDEIHSLGVPLSCLKCDAEEIVTFLKSELLKSRSISNRNCGKCGSQLVLEDPVYFNFLNSP